MNYSTRINCPYCRAPHKVQLSIDLFENPERDVVLCMNCIQTFVYHYVAEVQIVARRLETLGEEHPSCL